jgi:integrase
MNDRKPTAHHKFTADFLAGIPDPPAGKRQSFRDTKHATLALRVEAPKQRTFFWFRKVDGRPTFKMIGRYPTVSIEDARAHALDFDKKWNDYRLRGWTGENPFAKPKKELHAATVPTFTQLIEAYCTLRVRTHANNPVKAEAVTRRMLKTYFKDWEDLPIDAITIEHVLEVRNRLGTKYHQANRLVERLRAIFRWSAKNVNGRVNFWPCANPAKDIELHDKKKHEPARRTFLQPEELVRFKDCLKNEPDKNLRDFLTIALGTGARRSNITAMEWAAINFDGRVWHIGETKSGEPYNVDLTPAVLKVLERRRAEIPESAEYVFPSYGKSGHVSDLKNQWHEFRKRAGIPHIRIHDLRRTCGSYQAIAGVSLQQIGASLGHASMQSTLIYAKLHSEAVRAARETGEAKMLSMERQARKRLKASSQRQLKAAHA